MDRPSAPPRSLVLAASSLVLLAALRCAREVLTPRLWGEPAALLSTFDVAALLGLSWGLLLGWRIAWWLATGIAFASTALAALVLAHHGLRIRAWLAGADELTGAMLSVGGLSAFALAALLAPATRAAFRRQPRERTELGPGDPA